LSQIEPIKPGLVSRSTCCSSNRLDRNRARHRAHTAFAFLAQSRSPEKGWRNWDAKHGNCGIMVLAEKGEAPAEPHPHVSQPGGRARCHPCQPLSWEGWTAWPFFALRASQGRQPPLPRARRRRTGPTGPTRQTEYDSRNALRGDRLVISGRSVPIVAKEGRTGEP